MNPNFLTEILELSATDAHQLMALHHQRQARWPKRHGKMSYLEILEHLPILPMAKVSIQNGHVCSAHQFSKQQIAIVKERAQELIPWKKGPFEIDGLYIDGEWRSDQKRQRLDRIAPDLKDKRILDIGCNNGYYMFRMALNGAKHVLGIDPIHHVYAQFLFLQHFYQQKNVAMGLWGVQELNHFKNSFDVIFSMGIIYHHRDPIMQLIEMRQCLRPGGFLILESIGINSPQSIALFPADRYAQMGNVWFVPSVSCLENWCLKAKFSRVEILSSTPLTSEEQRVTDWSGPVSLADFLDKNDASKTIEGHPVPYRHLLKATL